MPVFRYSTDAKQNFASLDTGNQVPGTSFAGSVVRFLIPVFCLIEKSHALYAEHTVSFAVGPMTCMYASVRCVAAACDPARNCRRSACSDSAFPLNTNTEEKKMRGCDLVGRLDRVFCSSYVSTPLFCSVARNLYRTAN